MLMNAWQWAPVVLAAISAVFVMASILWSIFDVRKDDRLDQTTTTLWLLLLLAVPLFGVVAWLCARPRLGPHADSLHFKKLP